MKAELSEKLRLHKIISIAITLVGIAMMIVMMVVENEPGALSLLLIVVGAGWYLVARTQLLLSYKL